MTKLALFALFFLGLWGCQKTSTDAVFSQVQKEVMQKTQHTIYWDAHLDGIVEPISLETLSTKALDEEDVVQIVLLNNKNLQALYESLGVATSQLTQAGLWKNPIFSFSYKFATKAALGDLIDMGLMQNFLDILLVPLKKRMAQADLAATKNKVIAQVLEIIAQAKIAFSELQVALAINELKKQLLLAHELSFEACQKLRAAGNVVELQVLENQSLYDEMRLDIASQEIVILEAREKLSTLMGLWGRQIGWKTVSVLPKVPDKEGNFSDIENTAILNSVDLAVAQDRLRSMGAQLGLDTSRLVFPQFDLGVDSEREEGIWYVGPSLNIALPLFDVGKASRAKARAMITQAWNQYTALAVAVRSKARTARFSLLNTFRQMRYLEEVVVPLSERMTQAVLLQHNAMQMGIFELLTAKREEIEKKIRCLQMQQEYWRAKITLQTLLYGHMLGENGYNTSMP